MSDGLHHVAPASFFPTAKELSSGLQWFREHPILAAAAATAVSVITYLNTAEDGELLDVSARGAGGDADADADGTKDDDRHALPLNVEPAATPLPPRRRASSPSVLAAPAEAGAGKTSPPLRRASTPANDRATPPALRKPGSEGKMSPAAVSWVDEHGGSLTQVFEHLTTAHDDDDDDDVDGHDLDGDAQYPDLDHPLRASYASRMHGRPPTPRRQRRPSEDSFTAEETSPATATTPTHWMGALGMPSPLAPTTSGSPMPQAGERQTESPQWGWYVPITPPQDHITGAASSLPRAVEMPPSANASSRSAAVTTAAAIQAATTGSAASATTEGDAFGASSAMRRSASGRIKAA